jgi:hypothetical protein
MTDGMFLALWTKYLPVIRILLKKSVKEEQQVSLGKLELQSADSRKNANYTFSITIVNGKVENGIGGKPIGKDLFSILNNDLMVSDFMQDKTITISLGKNSLLTLKSEPVPVSA